MFTYVLAKEIQTRINFDYVIRGIPMSPQSQESGQEPGSRTQLG